MPTKSPLDDPEVAQAVKDDVAAGRTNIEIARLYNVNEATIRRFRERHGLATSTPRAAVEDQPSREELLEHEVKQLRRTTKASRKAQVAEERVLQSIHDALHTVAPEPLAAHYVAPAPTEDAHHSQAVLLSDWHAGEVVDAEQMNRLNEFNWEILKRRVAATRSSLLSFKKVRPELTELQLWFLGDMCSGDIHEELSETNEFPFAEQCVRVGHLMADLVEVLATHYPQIAVSCVCGNHPRLKKPHASKKIFDNLDWVAYQLMAARLGQLPNVYCEIAPGPMLPVDIAGRTVLLWHGDGVRSSMPGVPWGGVMRRWNELRKSYQQQGIDLDGVALGHFHQANAVSGNVWMNGSLIGANEYSLKNFGGGEAPCQLLLTFDNDAERLTDVSYITPA